MGPDPKRKLSRRGRAGEGRPSKRTPEMVALIAGCLGDGLTDEEASAVAGIDPHTLSRWRKEDPEFCAAVKRTEALRLRARIARIESGEVGWQSVCWILERTLPDRYGRREVQNRVAIACGTPEFRISVEQAESLRERSAALEDEAKALLNGRAEAAGSGGAENRLQGLL